MTSKKSNEWRGEFSLFTINPAVKNKHLNAQDVGVCFSSAYCDAVLLPGKLLKTFRVKMIIVNVFFLTDPQDPLHTDRA